MGLEMVMEMEMAIGMLIDQAYAYGNGYVVMVNRFEKLVSNVMFKW